MIKKLLLQMLAGAMITMAVVASALSYSAWRKLAEFEKACVQAGGKPATENRTGQRACMAGTIVIPVEQDS